MLRDSPLGRKTTYPDRYSPDLLYPIARTDNRRALGIEAGKLPFRGEDLWTAYDLSWLAPSGKPRAAIATLRVPATSPRLVESKSMKLYFDSLAMTAFDTEDAVIATIARDLSRVCESVVEVELSSPQSSDGGIVDLPGTCIDDIDVHCDHGMVDPSLLFADDDAPRSESLHSHLLRSLCPVTGQPDIGSILVRYHGPPMNREALLRYLVSYRSHSDFHENCVERIFLDLKKRCSPSQLSVYARYNRRGGLDINPFRSDWEDRAPDLRLRRQ